MPESNVIGFSEDVSSMTFKDGLAFIARTRRQLDRFDTALPDATGRRLSPENDTRLRAILDDLESDIHRLLNP